MGDDQPEGFETSPERRSEDKGVPRSMLPALIALAALVTIGAALGLAVGLGGGENGDGNAGIPTGTISANEIPRSVVVAVCIEGGERAIATLSSLQEQGLLEALVERALRFGFPKCADAVLEIKRAGETLIPLPLPPGVRNYASCVREPPFLSPAVCRILFPARFP